MAGDSVTMLFNNAGIMPARPFLKFTSEDIEKLFKVNVLSQYWTLQEYLPEFLSKDYGHIISMVRYEVKAWQYQTINLAFLVICGWDNGHT